MATTPFETIERAAYDLRPFWVADIQRITGSGVASGAATSVSDPNAVYRDGSRSMTGDLNMGGNDVINVATVDGVDVSQLAVDFAAHVVATDPHPQYAFDTNTVGAGAGLTGGGGIGSNPILDVGAGLGIVVNADDVALGTPSAASAVTTNSVTGSTHTHQVIYTTTGAATSLVGTDASGNIVASGNLYAGNSGGSSAVVTPMRLDGSQDDLYIVNAVTDVAGRGRVIVRTRGEVDSLIVDGPNLSVLNGAASVTLAVDSLGNFDITPTGTLIRVPTTARMQTPNYASQTTGWAVSGAGEADFRYLYVDEMHAKSFIADLEQALAGGQIIAKSVAVLGRAFTAPAITAGGAATFRAPFGNAGTTNSLVVTGPAGVLNNDQMVIIVAWWNQTLTMPSGWTQIGSTQTISDGSGTRFARVYRRTAASEPGSYTFTLSSVDDIEVAGVCYSGIDLTAPIDASNAGRTNTTGTQLRADEVTTVTAGAILLYFGAAMDNGAGGDTITPPGGMTARRNATNGTWVRCIVADEVRATAGPTGARIASLSSAEASAGFLLALRPAPTNATTLWVRDLPSAPNMAAFQAGDIVRLRQFSRAGGGLSITDCWGAVTNYADGSGADEGLQSWTFTRSAPPNAGAMSEGAVVQPDAIVLDYGTSGNGFYEVNAIDGIYAQNSPYAQIVTWTGHPATGRVVRGRYGNLRGIFGAGDEYGLFAGSGVTDADAYLRLSNLGNRLNNIPIQLYNSGTQTVNLSSTGTDVWIGTSTSDRRLNWNGSVLTVTGAINVQSISGLNYAGAPSPGGAANSIVGQGSLATQSTADWITQITGRPGISSQGQLLTNAPGAPGAGLWITANYIGWHDGANWRTYVDNNGRFYFRGPSATALLWDGASLIGYNASGNEQWRHDATTGRISTAGGYTYLDANGLTMFSPNLSLGGVRLDACELKWSIGTRIYTTWGSVGSTIETTFTHAGTGLTGARGFNFEDAVKVGNTERAYFPDNSNWYTTGATLLVQFGPSSIGAQKKGAVLFHQAGSRVDALTIRNGTMVLGEDIGWGAARIEAPGGISTAVGMSPQTITSVSVAGACLTPIQRSCTLTGWTMSILVNTTHTPTDHWLMELRRLDTNALLDSFYTSAYGGSVWFRAHRDLNIALTTSILGVYINAIRIGSPGQIQMASILYLV